MSSYLPATTGTTGMALNIIPLSALEGVFQPSNRPPAYGEGSVMLVDN